MTAQPNLERRLAEYYASEPPLRAPDRVLLGALETIDSTPQRRGPLAPWRYPKMPTYAKLAAAVAVVAVVAIGVWQFAAAPGPGGQVTPAPTDTPSVSPTPSVTPSASPIPVAAPLTGVHTSEMYGLTVSYPDGWRVEEGTEEWGSHSLAGFGSPLSTADLIHHPADPDLLFMGLSSHAFEAGESGSEWADAFAAEPDPWPCPDFDAIVVAGLDGRLYTCNEPMRAVFWNADRGYVVWIYRSGALPWAADVYDLAWLNDVLETVEIQ